VCAASRRDTERGTATTEALLGAIPIAVFLVLSPILYRWWSTDQVVRMHAHRKTFFEAVGIHDVNEGSPDRSAQGWKNANAIAGWLSLRKMPNSTVYGEASDEVRSTGILPLTLQLERRAFVIRPPWTMGGHPFVRTQTAAEIRFRVNTKTNETEPVGEWFEKAYGISDRVKSGLRLGD